MDRGSRPIPVGATLVDRPQVFSDADALARAIFDDCDGDVRLALPLGLGKPIILVNALVQTAVEDPTLKLSIFTALTLLKPQPSSGLEARFLEPAMDRLFGTAPPLLYAEMIAGDGLPDNIRVSEFFFQAGSWLGNDYAQRHYISANYTHALDVLIAQNPNVLVQLMPRQGDLFSMSCNTDISADLFARRKKGELDFIAIAETCDALPFMSGPAEIPAGDLAMVLEPAREIDLFSVPRQPVSRAQHAIGLHVSRLIRDGGTLQIGIGGIGDAVAQALLSRDRGDLDDLWRDAPFPFSGEDVGPFEEGLYAVSEMLVGGLLSLFDAGILRREVDGAAIHAGFFVDARDMYARLREMSPERRAKIQMMPVSFTNALYGDEAAKRTARRHARFVNAAMQVSLLGDAMSDAAEPGAVVSGVGGQFNFFEQAFALEDAHAILTLPATRTKGGSVTSNIVWQLAVTTVPRHMRDVVVTEYGVAFLRGQTDEEVVKRLICIADSRFQGDLLEEARSAGKIDRAWQVPAEHTANTPETLSDWLAPHRDVLPAFPFGTDFTEIERRLLPALARLKNAVSDPKAMAGLIWASFAAPSHPNEAEAMSRMGFSRATRATEPLEARLLRGALRKAARNGD